MRELSTIDLVGLRLKPPQEALAILTRVESLILETLATCSGAHDSSEVRVRSNVIDWLVDQILFVQEAWTRLRKSNLSEEDALWCLEMLSLPECLRIARNSSCRRQLIDEALVQHNIRWRDVLLKEQPFGQLQSIPRSSDPRSSNFPYHGVQLTPYRSRILPPRRWPNPWKTPIDLFLHFNQSSAGSLIQPLHPSSWVSFWFELRTLGGIMVLDVPREYDKSKAVEQLLQRLGMGQSALGDLKYVRGMPPEQRKAALKLLGVSEAGVLHQCEAWEGFCARLEQDIAQLSLGKIGGARRNAILQRHLGIPMTLTSIQMRILPFDLGSTHLSMILGAWMYMHGLLSTWNQRRLRKFIEAQLYSYAGLDASPQQVRSLVPEAIWR